MAEITETDVKEVRYILDLNKVKTLKDVKIILGLLQLTMKKEAYNSVPDRVKAYFTLPK